MASRLARLLWKMSSFAGIGGGVFVLGLLLQLLLIQAGMNEVAAFTLQLVVTLALNIELNRRYTWGDRVHGVRAIVKVAAGRITMAIVSWPLFLLLVSLLHVNSLLANGATVVFTMGVNFLMGELWAFKSPSVLPLLENERMTE